MTVSNGDAYDTDRTDGGSRSLYVGRSSTGSLTIESGGKVGVSGFVQVSFDNGSEGAIHVSGSGSQLSSDQDLNIGVRGNGKLSIHDQATVITNSTGQIGLLPGGHGVVTVSGAGSRWTISNSLEIGRDNDSRGTLILNKDGVVSVGGGQGQVHIGRNAGSMGDIHIGAISGDAAADAGELDAAHVQFMGGEGALVFNHTGTAYDFAPDISGSGTIQLENGATMLSGNNSTYLGDIRLLGGALLHGTQSNLGGQDATLRFDGGTLRVTDAGVESIRQPIRLDPGGGRFDMDFNSLNGEAVTLDTDINGKGTLIKRGRGDLHVTGNNHYGATRIEEGELIGTSRSISGDVFIAADDTAALSFRDSSNGEFMGDIYSADYSTMAVSKEGAGRLRLGGISKANWLLEEGELVTAAERFLGYATVGSAASLRFEQARDAVFAGAILGDGTFQKTGPGTLYMIGNNALFNGTSHISEGTLSVGDPLGNGNLGGAINIADGATLSGTGTVGTMNSGPVTVQSGGTIAPGSSIGTLTVAGDLVFQPGSRYAVEVAPDSSDSDRIDVKGSATLGGSVVHIGLAGDYRPQATYRILSADNGLIGSFDGISSDFAFLTPHLAYDNHHVDLTLQRNGIHFDQLAHTPNQIATARGLESLPDNSALRQRIQALPNQATPAIFDTLSGEIHAGTASALAAATDHIRDLPLSHLRTNLSAGGTPGALLTQTNQGVLPTAALPLWAQVTHRQQHMKGDGNADALKQSTSGIFLGGDHVVGKGWRLGAALAYTDGRIRLRDRDSTADTDTYSATVYGGKALELGTGHLNLMAGGAYSWHRIKTSRYAGLADWNHNLKARYRAHTTQLFGEVGYALSFGDVTLEPFASLAWSRLSTRSFTESGGLAALSGQHEDHNLSSSTLGLRAATALELGQAQTHIYGVMGWRHAFGRTKPHRDLRFDGGQVFTITGTPIARDSAVLELGADIALSKKARIGASYHAQMGGGNRDHGGSLHVRWQF